MKIKIITDSTADVPEEIAAKYDIDIVPLSVIFDGVEYKAGIDLSTEKFYEMLDEAVREGKPMPHTSLTPRGTFIDELEPFCNKDDVFVAMFLIAKEMSGTYYSAKDAIEDLKMKNVHLFDTRSVTFQLGALVTEAAKLAQTDISVEDFIAKCEDLNDRVSLYASIGDLKFLRMGGRLSGAAMALGQMLQLKPIIYIDKKVEVASKALGQIKATKWVVTHVAEERDESMPLYFGHSVIPKIVEDYKTKYADELKLTGEELTYFLGPVVGVHAGPGAAGIAYFKKKN